MAKIKKDNEEHWREYEKETKKKFLPVARHAAAVAREKSGAPRYYTKKRGSGRPVRAVRVKAAAAAAEAAEAKVHPAIRKLKDAYEEAGEHLKKARDAAAVLKGLNDRHR